MTPLPLRRRRRRLRPLSFVLRTSRAAYTMVEMLIVVSILIMLVAVTLPVAKKVVDGNQTREASRQLNAYVAMAKARALQTGRPCGLFLSFPNPPLGVTDPTFVIPTGPNANVARFWPVRHVTQLFLAEVPAPYSGSTTNSLAKIADPNGQLPLQQRRFLPLFPSGAPEQNPGDPETSVLLSLINPGEIFLVRFNYKGEWYRCIRGLANTAYPDPNYLYYIGDVPPANPFNRTLPPGYNDNTTNNINTPGKPFQILRSPRPIGNALELPRGVCIDLTYSGVGAYSRGFPAPSNLTSIPSNLAVMFSTNGDIDSLYVNGFPTNPPAASLYFLLGKVEKAGDPYAANNTTLSPPIYNQAIYTSRQDSNLADPTALWVIVSRGTGQVTTTENLPSPVVAAANPNQIGAYIYAARTAATLGEQMGGQ